MLHSLHQISACVTPFFQQDKRGSLALYIFIRPTNLFSRRSPQPSTLLEAQTCASSCILPPLWVDCNSFPLPTQSAFAVVPSEVSSQSCHHSVFCRGPFFLLFFLIIFFFPFNSLSNLSAISTSSPPVLTLIRSSLDWFHLGTKWACRLAAFERQWAGAAPCSVPPITLEIVFLFLLYSDGLANSNLIVVTKSHKVNFQRTIGSSNKMAPTDFRKTLVILLLWSCHWWLTLNTICFNYPPCHWEGERLFHSVKESAWIHMTSYRIAESVNSLPNFLSGNLFPCPKSGISKGVMSWQANVRSEFKSFSVTTNSTTSSTSWLHYCSN